MHDNLNNITLINLYGSQKKEAPWSQVKQDGIDEMMMVEDLRYE